MQPRFVNQDYIACKNPNCKTTNSKYNSHCWRCGEEL